MHRVIGDYTSRAQPQAKFWQLQGYKQKHLPVGVIPSSSWEEEDNSFLLF